PAAVAKPDEKRPPLPPRSLPPPGTAVLIVEALSKKFGGLVAVDNVSFSLVAGEILALIGPNGAGKTTSFNLITGALKASAGKVTFAGRGLAGIKPHQVAALGMARTFQHVKLRPTMSVVENVMLGCYSRTRAGFAAGALKLDRAEEAAVREEALRELRRVGLAEKANEPAGNLPLGQQRLVEGARAAAAPPAPHDAPRP